MSMPGFYEWLIIFGVAILLFGGKKLPALGTAVGESIRNFKAGIKDADKPTSAAPMEPAATENSQKQIKDEAI